MTTNEYPTADGKYYVKSYGNGWAYSIEDNRSPDTDPLWFQDEDAIRLQEETEDFTNTMVLDMWFEMIEGS
jgi:hypothetical protein